MKMTYTTDDMRRAADALAGTRHWLSDAGRMLRQAADEIDALRRLVDAVNGSAGITLCLEKGCGTCAHGAGDCDSRAVVQAIRSINNNERRNRSRRNKIDEETIWQENAKRANARARSAETS